MGGAGQEAAGRRDSEDPRSITEHIDALVQQLDRQSDVTRLAVAASLAERAFPSIERTPATPDVRRLLRMTLDGVWVALAERRAGTIDELTYETIAATCADEGGEEISPLLTGVAGAIAYVAQAKDSRQALRWNLWIAFDILDVVLVDEGVADRGSTFEERLEADRKAWALPIVQLEVQRQLRDAALVIAAGADDRWVDAVNELRRAAAASPMLG